MSFTISRDANNNIIKKDVTISSTATIDNSKSIGTTGETTMVSVSTLNLNGTNLTASSTQLNYLNATPGTATASKALIVDSSRNITGINAISANNLIVNGTNITASLYTSTPSDDLNSPYLTPMLQTLFSVIGSIGSKINMQLLYIFLVLLECP